MEANSKLKKMTPKTKKNRERSPHIGERRRKEEAEGGGRQTDDGTTEAG